MLNKSIDSFSGITKLVIWAIKEESSPPENITAIWDAMYNNFKI